LRRAFVVVLDACGVGALPDAADYGDAGTNTLGHLAHEAGGLELPTLARLGLGSIIEIEGVPATAAPVVHGRLGALGPGKDSTAGHWGLMGVSAPTALPTYPDGFPEEIVSLVSAVSGRAVICNRPCNGIEAIERSGPEHLETGALIVYTSQDSVLQIAAHIDRLAPDELYEICGTVRGVLPPEHAVGRVIARPFAGGARRVDAHRRAARLLDPAARPQLPGGASGRRGRGAHRREGRAAVRGRGDRRAASRRDERARARGDGRADSLA
jgi:phosphopentomutase